MSVSPAEMIGEAVHQNRTFSLDSSLERLFARLFRGLVYPQIWEDPVCDMAALDLSASDDIVCIASGGCNVMSYLTARPSSITAVDLSPWHVELNRLKLQAAKSLPDHRSFYTLFGHADRPENVDLLDRYVLPELPADAQNFWNSRDPLIFRKTMFALGFYRFGVLGRFLGIVHWVTRMAKVDFGPLLRAKSIEEQTAVFDAQLAPLFKSRVIRFAVRRRASLFGFGIPPAQYDKLAADADGDIVQVLEARVRKLFCDFPISENYFAWQAASRGYKEDGTGPVPPYLEPGHFETLRRATDVVTVLNRSVTDALADADAGSKSVYILLDAQDWMTDDQLTRLWEEITRTSTPDARVLFRTGGVTDILPGRVPASLLDQWTYDAEASRRAFSTDRSAIYGNVHLYRRRIVR